MTTVSVSHKETYSTFTGVYIPSLLTMFGVVLFLRMGWIVGMIDLSQSLLIITLTLGLALVTAVSIASIASNFSAQGSGIYDMLSNELGSELGSAIGIPIYLAQTFTACFCVLGIVESLQPLFPAIPLHVVGIVVLAILAGVAYLSFGFAVKIQIAIFLVLVLSLAAFFFGQPYTQAAEEILPIPRQGSFWSIFSMFFPVAMGVECGISMSDRLKTPSRSILIGSVAAVVTAFFVYAWFAKALFQFAPGDVLRSDPYIVHKCSQSWWLTHITIWLLAAASGIGSLLSATKTLQAIALDGILSLRIGKDDRFAIGITLFIAFSAIAVGNIHIVSSTLTMVLLAAYGLINLMAAFEGMMDNPSWRPSFQVVWGIPLAGALFSCIAMFMIDPSATFAVIALTFSGYFLVKASGIGKEKDDLHQSLLFFFSRSMIYRLARESPSKRSWRPNFLVFTRSPLQFTNLLLFARELTKKHGFLTVASVFSTQQLLKKKEKEWIRLIQQSLRSHKTQALVEVVSAETPAIGIKQIIQTYGIGPLVPNTIILGQTLQGTYSDIIAFAVQEQRNVLIFQDHPRNTYYIPPEVDIWWDEKQKKNNNLMLLLAFMLKRSPLFRRTQFTLKSMASTEMERSEKELYFQKMLEENRMEISSKVFLGDDLLPYASKDGLSFIGMRASQEGESLEEYENYYKQQMVATKDLCMVIFTLSFEHEEVRSRIY